MSKAKPSFGKKNKVVHKICRRCGKKSFHIQKGYCSYCGFGRSSKMKKYKWKTKLLVSGVRVRSK